jgi:EpsI family protein
MRERLPNISFAFLRHPAAMLVSGILLAHVTLFSLAPTTEFVPTRPPLRSFATESGPWSVTREMELDPETQEFLHADDTLNRVYSGPDGQHVTLFVAFFKSQRAGVTPHSPKICLPGAGWTAESATKILLSAPGEAQPFPVNRYAVRHGEDRTLAIYWYATAHHTMADEYISKLYLMDEGLRHRRSDEALYRVIVPVIDGRDADAEQTAVHFIQNFYPSLKRQMWAE